MDRQRVRASGRASELSEMATLTTSAAIGTACGLGGAAALAAASKLKQHVTGRPDSYVPAHTLAHLLKLRPAPVRTAGHAT